LEEAVADDVPAGDLYYFPGFQDTRIYIHTKGKARDSFDGPQLELLKCSTDLGSLNEFIGILESLSSS